MLDAAARAIGGAAVHFVLRTAHGVADFADQSLALTGSMPTPPSQLPSAFEYRSRNSIDFHSAFLS